MISMCHRLRQMIESDKICVMITTVDVQGSGPREPGSQMLVGKWGQFTGTIGGGALEWQAIAFAQKLIAKGERTFKFENFLLGPDLGQCCGGKVKLFFELFDETDLKLAFDLEEISDAEIIQWQITPQHIGFQRTLVESSSDVQSRSEAPVLQLPTGDLICTQYNRRHILHLFGAGHVGKAVMLAFASLPFHVIWWDSRSEMFPSVAPANVTKKIWQETSKFEASNTGCTIALIMTHSHSLDLDLCERTLKSNLFHQVGLIGSQTKANRFKSQLRKLGVSEGQLDYLSSPIGIQGIESKEPAIIAASVAADILLCVAKFDQKVNNQSNSAELTNKKA